MHGDLENGTLVFVYVNESFISYSNHDTRPVKNLPARDNTICKEEWPDSEPLASVTVPSNDIVLVANPVFISRVDSSRVMDTENVDIFYFEAGTLKVLKKTRCEMKDSEEIGRSR